jgi:lipid II:glycine glycyltransferase (peptidoglycan interpeptide bridge formation enzyme)
VELRPKIQTEYSGFQPGELFWFHQLDLSSNTEQLFDNLHKDSIQRKIRRAEREGLVCDSGRSERHVREFYRLLLLTRRRHKLFPQPRSWFRNLVAGMGDKIEIRLARKNNKTVGAMLTLRHGSSVIYKYGCSDESLHNLGGMPFLFWRLIEESKAAGAQDIDFGRSDTDSPGLVTFKDRFGTKRRRLTYQRFSNSQETKKSSLINSHRLRRLIPILPDLALSAGGRILYRHMG